MPESLFIEHFRLNKSTFRRLCRDLRHYTTLKGSLEVPLEVKVRIIQYFLHIDIGNIHTKFLSQIHNHVCNCNTFNTYVPRVHCG